MMKGSPTASRKRGGCPNGQKHLSHTTWECKYHIVFAPKYRRQAIYGKIKTDIGKILREFCERKDIEIIEAELCKYHVHMLIRIPPKYNVFEIMGYLKRRQEIVAALAAARKWDVVGELFQRALRRNQYQLPSRRKTNRPLSGQWWFICVYDTGRYNERNAYWI